MNFRLTTMLWSIYISCWTKTIQMWWHILMSGVRVPKNATGTATLLQSIPHERNKNCISWNSPKKYDGLIQNSPKVMDIVGNAPKNLEISPQSIAVLVIIQVCSIDQNKCFKIQNLSVSLVFKSVLCSFAYSKISSPFPPWSSNFKKVGPSSMSLFMKISGYPPPNNTAPPSRKTSWP